MKIRATVVYPVYVTVEIKEKPKTEEKINILRNKIFDEADKLYDCSSIKPIIHDADITEIID